MLQCRIDVRQHEQVNVIHRKLTCFSFSSSEVSFSCFSGNFTAPKLGGAVVLAEHYSLLVEAVGNIQVPA